MAKEACPPAITSGANAGCAGHKAAPSGSRCTQIRGKQENKSRSRPECQNGLRDRGQEKGNKVMRKYWLLSGVVAVGMLLSTSAQATIYNVPGTSDPWLAGVANGGFDPSSGLPNGGENADVAPTQSPVQVMDSFVSPGNTIYWFASGQVGHPGDVSGPNGSVPTSRVWGAQNGIPDIGTVPINALIGVFLGATPSVFVMGASGSAVVPPGTTGFYMGTMDGYGWANNTGSFDVTVVPEPTTCIAGALLLLPFGVSTLRGLRKNRAA